MKRFKPVLVSLMALLMLFSLASCGGSKLEYPEGVETYVFTDDYGREVEIRKDIDKIVATGPNAQMILYTIAPEMLVGLTQAPSTDQMKYFPSNYNDLPTLGQFYGKKKSLNLENLMTTDTQIIIDVGEPKEDGKSDMDDIQKETGIATIFIEGTLDNYDEAYIKLGKILGKETEAAALAKYCKDTKAMTEAAQSKIKTTKTVYYGISSTGLNGNAKGNVQAAVIEFIGAENAIVPPEESTGKDGGDTVDLEELHKVNPDVVVLGVDGPYNGIKTNPQWNTLKAVKAGAVYEVPSLPYSWMSAPPCVNQVLGARWLGKLVYPEAYSNDIRKDAKEYYKLFWHYDLSDAELNAMLAHSYKK